MIPVINIIFQLTSIQVISHYDFWCCVMLQYQKGLSEYMVRRGLYDMDRMYKYETIKETFICLYIIKEILKVYSLTVADVEFPAERRRLRPLEKQPQPYPGQRMPKMPKRLIDMRGPELVNNKLIHKQFGIRVCNLYSMHFSILQTVLSFQLCSPMATCVLSVVHHPYFNLPFKSLLLQFWIDYFETCYSYFWGQSHILSFSEFWNLNFHPFVFLRFLSVQLFIQITSVCVSFEKRYRYFFFTNFP